MGRSDLGPDKDPFECERERQWKPTRDKTTRLDRIDSFGDNTPDPLVASLRCSSPTRWATLPARSWTTLPRAPTVRAFDPAPAVPSRPHMIVDGVNYKPLLTELSCS